MKYYAKNSWEAKRMLLEANGGQSYALVLGACQCGDGYTITDPMNEENIAIICDNGHQTTEED